MPATRIVAFGDSLTVGYQSPTPAVPAGAATPYGQFLQQMLDGRAEVVIRGISGELTADMLQRFTRAALALRPNDVIILGGTNDLGWGAEPAAIARNLIELYHRSRTAGARPIAVTVPSIRGFDALIPPRQELNQLIRDHCAANQFPCIDLFSATAEPGNQRLAERFCNDGLHLTTDGYRLLAEMLFRSVYS